MNCFSIYLLVRISRDHFKRCIGISHHCYLNIERDHFLKFLLAQKRLLIIIMSGFNGDIASTLKSFLPADFDEDVMSYITTIVEDMSPVERTSTTSLEETIGPFLLDSGFASSEEDVTEKCKALVIAFGGSGMVGKGSATHVGAQNDEPQLLAAPIKMIDTNSELREKKGTYGGAVMVSTDAGTIMTKLQNMALDAADIPINQKEVRRRRKDNEVLQKMLRAEAAARARVEAELAKARMAAIQASRKLGRQSNCGVNIERFSIPHPSGSADLLTDASLKLSPGRRYGLIGRNGAGKSTLLNRIAGYRLDGLSHLRILLVDQHVEGNEQTPMQWVLNADVERTALLEEEALLTEHLHGNTKSALPTHLVGINIEVALQECFARMDTIGVSTAEARARNVLIGLGFTDGSMNRPTNDLSGGWAMRAALAAALYVKPHLLLLDEPTNHLDLHALVWLQNYLTNKFEGIAIIVSHDQVFLDEVCTDILELKTVLGGQATSSLEHFSGDFATYQETCAQQRIVQARAFDAYEREKEKLREFINREGKKYDNSGHQNQRKMKMKQLADLTPVAPVEDEADMVINFPRPNGCFDNSLNLISVKDVSFSWPTEEEVSSVGAADQAALFSNIDFTVNPSTRMAILGKNGCGKSSLLQLLIGSEQPTTGSVTKYAGCRVTMLQQHHYKGEQLDPAISPLEHLRRMPQEDGTAVGVLDMGTRHEETAHRGYLSNFGVRPHCATLPVKYLSGGQRMRVALAIALYKRPDVLILDEVRNLLSVDKSF